MQMEKLDINPRFRDLIRPLNADELERLEISLLKEGLLDSIKIWPYKGKSFIVDGHHRYGKFEEYGDDIKGFKTEKLDFNSEDEACEWIIEHQLQRRNVNQNERVLYIGQLFELRKKRQGGVKKDERGSGLTAEIIAEEMNVSPRTVTRAAEVVQAYNKAAPEVQEKYINSEISSAELVRSLTAEREERKFKRDKTRDQVTEGLKFTGEKILKDIRALRSRASDLETVCTAAGLDAGVLAPELVNLDNKLRREEKQAEALTTVTKVDHLCPNKDSETKCRTCKGVIYATTEELEELSSHFGTEEKKAAVAK